VAILFFQLRGGFGFFPKKLPYFLDSHVTGGNRLHFVMSYSVGKVAQMAGVSVKTMHHYDEIGLLSATGRSGAGYRKYEDSDIERLQRILFYRELGFNLREIKTIVDDPDVDSTGHLKSQRRLLTERIERLRKMVAAIDNEMEADKMDIKLTPEERLEIFGDFLPEDYEEEAKQRWGNTDAYKESQRRVSEYTKDDWLAIKAEQEEVETNFAALFRSGAAPDSEGAMDTAEAHRNHITRWFYECGYEIHTGLGDMYVADERFRANYDKYAPGLSEFIKDAIHANAKRR
jgi:DNA-binding transcriptional MerR regulator